MKPTVKQLEEVLALAKKYELLKKVHSAANKAKAGDCELKFLGRYVLTMPLSHLLPFIEAELKIVIGELKNLRIELPEN